MYKKVTRGLPRIGENKVNDNQLNNAAPSISGQLESYVKQEPVIGVNNHVLD